ncbi:MAG: VIT1/CCC1 transporter family protein [Caldilineaceae bacterium]|nr:VIT1/CCC1 transporter family protein [Caldilineaceae bacterium]
MATDSETEKFLTFLAEERNSAALYAALATVEPEAKIAEVYRRLAATEEKHAEKWAEQLRTRGVAVPPFRPTWRTRTLIWVARRFGVQAILSTLSATEDSAAHGYVAGQSMAAMQAQERSHARLLRQISRTTTGGMAGAALAQIEGRHRSAGGNALRAAVLGANDGLVSNLSLVMGVAGAELAGQTVLITGLAGLLAGAISMALGEWLSVQSSRELYGKQIQTEAAEIASAPEEEVEELSLIYQARGLPEAAAHQLAAQLMQNQASALETLAREELGIDPAELGGSAWEAAITSFLLFSLGAIVPVLAFFFLTGLSAIVLSIALSIGGLFTIGAAITLFTGRSVWFSGTRQVFFGLAAAAITFTIGRLIGVSLAG